MAAKKSIKQLAKKHVEDILPAACDLRREQVVDFAHRNAAARDASFFEPRRGKAFRRAAEEAYDAMRSKRCDQ